MRQAIDWTHLSDNYRGKWVALAEDLTTVVAAGDTAKEAYEAATKHRTPPPDFGPLPAEP